MAKKNTKKPTKQAVVRYHSDWMRLIERSGPFLSLPVLLDTFPQGPSADDRDRRVQLKQAYESWLTDNSDVALHRAWIKYVLTNSLELPEDHIVDAGHIPQNLSIRVDVHHETLTPDIAVIEPEDKEENQPATPQMIVMIVPPDQALDKKIPGKNWVASPQTRMADLVRGCNDQGITFGLLTNGEQWMLVYSKQGETASFTTWYASIWFDEKITLRAFRDLLSERRFYGDPDRTLDKLFERSADDQHEVTDQLGLQVRDAIETLVSAIDEIDRERKRKLLAGFSEEQLYEACVTVMMRLVFLFFAEERRLLPVKESFYEQNYSLHTLFEQLQTQKSMGEEELEWAYSGWCRLLALFRAIHGGVQHDDMQLHAYGSSLFDPDRFPFLEGRPAGTAWRELESQPLPINDRTLLHVLEALKLLEVRGIGGGQRITRVMSFRELDVEDIGHIYESLLDHTAKRANGHVLGILGSKGKEPELSLDELEKQAEKSREALVEYLNDETGKTVKSIEKLLDAETKINESRLLAACVNDQAFFARVKPFANLVRENRSGDPIIIPDGSVYVTEGTDRRSSGTHYTPKSLTEPIVQYTLEPLVYEGPAEGKPQEEWKLKTPVEILELNVCDMACGSGAFLVQACRFMAERLVEAWEYIEQTSEASPADSQTVTGNIVVGTIEADQFVVEKNGHYATKTVRRPRITPLGELSKNDPSEELIPLDPTERIVYARRIVAQRCLFGVDINPLAAEMAKLSIWLLTLSKSKPFTFLDHAIRSGDSLVGLSSLNQLRLFNLEHRSGEQKVVLQFLKDQVEKALELRKEISHHATNSINDVEISAARLEEANKQVSRLNLVGDILLGAEFISADCLADSYLDLIEDSANETSEARTRETARTIAAIQVAKHFHHSELSEFQREVNVWVEGRTPFHWPLQFPEVFENDGFNAFIGNPPFIKGQNLTSLFGVNYREYLVGHLARNQRGSADICSYFFLRAGRLVSERATIGLLATKTIAQGVTREVGLSQLSDDEMSIYRAVKSRNWPGSATVEVAYVWIYSSPWNGECILDEVPVRGINTYLDSERDFQWEPKKLAANDSFAFKGSVILGDGFYVDTEEDSSILKALKYPDLVLPIINGKELNTFPDHQPRRRLICFRGWPLNRDAKGTWESSSSEQKKKWLADGIVPSDYPEKVAADYPACLEKVRSTVKPEREANAHKNSIARNRAKRWWRFGSYATELHNSIEDIENVVAITVTSKTMSPTIVSSRMAIDQTMIAFNTDSYAMFGVLASSITYWWAITYGAKMRTDARYILANCFQNFPYPDNFLKDLVERKTPQKATTLRVEETGENYFRFRRDVMIGNNEGLTKTYNRFHDPKDSDEGIETLRELHVQLDEAVVNFFGWKDVRLSHRFRETRQGTRFTISEPCWAKIWDHLLRSNQSQYQSRNIKESKNTRSKAEFAAAGLLFDDDDG